MSASSGETYDVQEIMRMIPHRFPFLLIDRIDYLYQPKGASRVGWKIRARKCVSMNEPFFPGHFPHRPVMPGVLIVEAMAQAAALLTADLSGPEMDVAIAGVDGGRFRKPVVPGDVLEIHAEMIRDRGQIVVFKCEAFVAGQPVAEAEVLAKMFPRQDAH